MLLASCFVILFFNAVAAIPDEVTIGLLVPSSASSVRTVWAVEAALDHARSLLPGKNIRLLVNDSGTTSDQCNSMMVWQYTAGCVAVLGTTSSTLTVPMSPVATGFRRPLISWSAGSSLLTSRSDNPYFLRTIPSDDRTGEAFFAICKRFGWSRMALVFTNDARGTSLADSMRSRVPDDFTLTRQSFRVGSATSMRAALSVIASLGHTVIGLHGAQGDLTTLLEMAAGMGMVGKGYTWLGSTWTGSVYPTVYKGKQFMGVIGVAVATQDTAEAQAFRNEMFTLHPTTSQSEWTVRDAGVYDAATAVIRGLQVLSTNPQLQALGDGPGLMQALSYYVDFAGASGRVKFTENGDILTSMDLVTIGTDGRWKQIGEFQPGTNQTEALQLTAPVIFGDGTVTPSKDYLVVYEAGDALPVDHDAQSLLLAFALGLVGTWSALIFVEQAISTYRTTTQRITAGETGDDEGGCRRGCAKRAFVRWEHIFWLACAAAAMGGVGVSCLSYIAFTSIQLPPEAHGLHLSLSTAGVSFIVTFAWIFAGLLFELKHSNATHTTANNKARPYVLKDSPADKEQKKMLNSSVSRTIAELKAAVSQLSRWTLLFILFTCTGVVGSHYLVAISLSAGQADLRIDGLRILYACVVCLIFVSLASVIFFHVLKSRVRLFAAPLMTIAIFISQTLVMKGCIFLYNPHGSAEQHVEEATGVDVSRLQAITSIIGFAFCFLFIGVQVTRLKLSRGTLDRLLEQCQDQLHRLEAQLADEKLGKQYAQLQAADAKNMLEMINFVRPLLRNHAFAHAMADRKGASLTTGGKADEGERNQGSVSIWALGLAATKNERTVASLLSELNAMPNLHSGPVHARAIADVKLTELLSHPVTLEIIKDTVMKSLAPESVALLLDIQRFRSVDKSALRLSLAAELLACYVATDAPYQVNISSTMRGHLQNAVRTGHVTGAMFDELEAEMLKLISTNTMDTFYSSTAFKFCCMLLEHPSYQLKTVIKRGANLSGVGNSENSSKRSNNRNQPHLPGQMEASRGSLGSRGSRFDSRDAPTPKNNNRPASLAAPGTIPSLQSKRFSLQDSPVMGSSGRTLSPDNEPPSPNPGSVAWGTDRTIRNLVTPDVELSGQDRDDSPVQLFPGTGSTVISSTRRLLIQKLQETGSSGNNNRPLSPLDSPASPTADRKALSDSSITNQHNDVIVPVQAEEHESGVGSPRMSEANMSILSEM